MTATLEQAASPQLAHQFEDLRQQHEADDLGIWLFLSTEAMFFGGLFLTYTIYRWQDEAAFEAASHQMELFWGTINTAVLLSSSLTIALATQAAEQDRRRTLIVTLLATIALGITFITIKMKEYYHSYELHHMPILGLPFDWSGEHAGHARLFFDLYFLMTGLHALHMVIGIVVMSIILARVAIDRGAGEMSIAVRMIGLYWHFVDIVWVFLFPMLYLVGAHTR